MRLLRGDGRGRRSISCSLVRPVRVAAVELVVIIALTIAVDENIFTFLFPPLREMCSL